MGVELQKVVETFLVASVASFYFPVVAGCSWPNQLMMNTQTLTKQVKGIDSLCFGRISEFPSVIYLNDLWLVAKIIDGTFQKINSRIGTLILVGKDKPFSGGLVNDRVLTMEPITESIWTVESGSCLLIKEM